METLDLRSKDTVHIDRDSKLLLQDFRKLPISSDQQGDIELTRFLLSCLIAWNASRNLSFSAIGSSLASCFESTSQWSLPSV